MGDYSNILDNHKGLKNVKLSEDEVSMTFCRTCKTCPSIVIGNNSDDVILGGDHEGFSTWTKEQFKDFTETVKSGIYDKFLEDEDINKKG